MLPDLVASGGPCSNITFGITWQIYLCTDLMDECMFVLLFDFMMKIFFQLMPGFLLGLGRGSLVESFTSLLELYCTTRGSLSCLSCAHLCKLHAGWQKCLPEDVHVAARIHIPNEGTYSCSPTKADPCPLSFISNLNQLAIGAALESPSQCCSASQHGM